ncbi:Dpr-interacting protein alpha [Carabus blaptoides fortunei]
MHFLVVSSNLQALRKSSARPSASYPLLSLASEPRGNQNHRGNGLPPTTTATIITTGINFSSSLVTFSVCNVRHISALTLQQMRRPAGTAALDASVLPENSYHVIGDAYSTTVSGRCSDGTSVIRRHVFTPYPTTTLSSSSHATIVYVMPRSRVAFQPEFAQPIVNLSVAIGRDATFRCLVHHLGGYRGMSTDETIKENSGTVAGGGGRDVEKQQMRRGSLCKTVGWVKADTKAIQAIHDHVITHNSRVSVSHGDHSTWNLHIRSVQEEDRGQYMCQINTDPMKSQKPFVCLKVGYLDVVVPPDFINEETSGDVMIPEGGTIKLTCRARGYPVPHVLWRREDGSDIIVREPNGQKTKLASYQGEILKLVKVSRSDMGAYMCIASNGVPPTVSKRITVSVHFHPVIHVPNQLVGAPLGTDVVLECHVEASPKSINYWIRDTGEMVISSEKYDVQVSSKSMFEVRMIVIIRNLQADDLGSYRCIAKNSLGEVESNIRLYEIPGPTRLSVPMHVDEDDYGDQFGSAEEDSEYELPVVASQPRHLGVPPAGVGVEHGFLVTFPTGVRGNHMHYVENHVPVEMAMTSRPMLSSSSMSKAQIRRSRLPLAIFFLLLLGRM